MKDFKYYSIILLLFSIIYFVRCKDNSENLGEQHTPAEKEIKVEMITDYGKIVLKLYNETPLHRDNFKKLVQEGVYDSILFHRVIEKFMVQAGDPESKNATKDDTLGSGSFGDKIPAEMETSLFHKRGALAAARDGNPDRASSGSQFYIVQGRVYNDSTLNVAEERINSWLAEYHTIKAPENKKWYDSLNVAIESENMEIYRGVMDTITKMAKTYEFQEHKISPSQREIYKTLGGAAHLDQNYTVFGEVIEGMDVVDTIAAQKVDNFARPINDIRIISMKIIPENEP